ncbi:hypothetical protein GF391_00300 [Candidatus Uhrbacteria bacterium]|nr:hypothetical protein [Candidatus Uhrbacteria bacterium]
MRINPSNSSIWKKSSKIFLFIIASFFACNFLLAQTSESQLHQQFDCGEEELSTPNLSITPRGLSFSSKPQIVNCNGGQCVAIPFLAQYIAAFYKYLTGVSLIVAAIMIIYGGILYIISATGAKVQDAKEKIKEAVIGLILFLGVYVILSNINPNLDSPTPLNIPCIKDNSFVLNDEPPENLQGKPMSPNAKDPLGNNVTYPTRLCDSVEKCQGFCDKTKTPPKQTTGMAELNEMQLIENSTGVVGNNKSLRPDAILALKRAGAIAQSWDGGPYEIVVYDGYRPLLTQIQAACLAMESDPDTLGTTVSFPGGSLHGIGVAVDVGLRKDGQDLTTCCDVSTQTQKNTEANVKLLQDIMSAAGFNRYCKEVWHFEWKTDGAPNRSKNCSWPPS